MRISERLRKLEGVVGDGRPRGKTVILLHGEPVPEGVQLAVFVGSLEARALVERVLNGERTGGV